MPFSWRWNGGTISLKLGIIWEMSVNCRMTFHREETMRTLSTLAMRALSMLATLILDVTFMPIRIAVVESRWLAGQSAPDPADPTESLLVSSWHFTQRRPVARSSPAPDRADPHEGGLRNS